MKRLTVFALVACCSTAAMATPAPNPANYDAFGIALLQKLEHGSNNQNVFISPFSIGAALSMAADGSAGQTRAAILHAIGVSGEGLARANASLIAATMQNPDAKVGVANAIWLRQDIPPRPSYVDFLRTNYHATAQAVHFGDPSAAAAINSWTRRHTLGLIDHLVDKTSLYDFAYLTNALAFKAVWTLPFKKNETRGAPFTDSDGKKHNVQMMTETGEFATLDAIGGRALRLPYGKGGYAAYIILPKGNNVTTILKNLGATGFDRIVQGMTSGRIAVSLPRFTARYDTSLNSVLKALGMTIAFSPDADFSVMRQPPPRLFIKNVQHASYLRVDEHGTTAAAATSVEFEKQGMMQSAKPFIVDHPFIFAIRDERTGTLLFIGTINRIPPA